MTVFPAGTFNAANVVAKDVPGRFTVGEFAAELTALGLMYDAINSTHLSWAALAAVGMPACNGVTMVTTMIHHYVDPHKVICDTLMTQVWNKPMTAPGTLTVEELKDVMCHKLSHPISSTVLVWMARSQKVKHKLISIGLGGAAVRLPAEFGAEKAASAFFAVVARGKEAAKSGNVNVVMAPVEALRNSVKATLAAATATNPMQEAINVVETFKTEYGYGVAWLAGYLYASFEATGAKVIQRSVINAYSVKTLCDTFPEAFAEGSEHHSMVIRWKKAQSRSGRLTGFGFFGATVPAAFGDPDQEASN
jgi:hypothetical protein